ncbi:MAG TPA: ferritin-like domain-containing protein [Candidatus Eisenbacteria bacterium]
MKSAEERLETLEDLFKEELKDIYSAEQQIIKALPKMIDGSDSEDLRAAFTDHLEVTREQARRIEEIMSEMGDDPKGKKCEGMEGLLKEGDELLQMEGSPAVIDAGLIGAAQRVEHYEIAAYGTARAHAMELGMDDAAELLQQSLTEEEEADQTLSAIAERGVNMEAEEGEEAGASRSSSRSSGSGTRRAAASSKKK